MAADIKKFELHGIVRLMDDMGRIVIPKEFRRGTGIKELDVLSISVSEKTVILSPVQNSLLDQVELTIQNYFDGREKLKQELLKAIAAYRKNNPQLASCSNCGRKGQKECQVCCCPNQVCIIDDLGRVKLPTDVLEKVGARAGDGFDISAQGRTIFLTLTEKITIEQIEDRIQTLGQEDLKQELLQIIAKANTLKM